MKLIKQKHVVVLQSENNTEQPIRLVFYDEGERIVDILEVKKITPKYAAMIATHVM